MARKSNKTSHVLHLLAGEEPIEETTEVKEETTESQEPEIQEPVTEQESEPDTPNISIVSTRNSESDPLADLIKQQLEEDFPEEILNTSSHDSDETTPISASTPLGADSSSHTAVDADAAPLAKANNTEDSEQAEDVPSAESAQTEPESISNAESAQTQLEDHPNAESVQSKTQEHSNTEPAQTEAQEHSNTEPAQTEAQEHSDTEPAQTEAQEHPNTEPAQTQSEERPNAESIQAEIKEEPKVLPHTEDIEASPSPPDSGAAQPSSAADTSSPTHYRFVNVMEYIIKDSVLDQMKKFDMCTCERCQVDTIALALTNCPAKYIVVDNQTVSPLLNYYSNKFMGTVTVELIKACTMVKENPRH